MKKVETGDSYFFFYEIYLFLFEVITIPFVIRLSYKMTINEKQLLYLRLADLVFA